MKLQNKPHTVRDIIVVGFALFAMFFGAGNVIFPPYLGVEAGPEWLGGFSAYFIADIGLAMCAVFALLRVGSSEAVTARLGKVPAAILMSALILCIGPMVAIPRTAATTFEMAIVPNISGVSSVVFSIIFFALILFLCIRQSAVVDIVGAVLTPLLLIGLAVIIIKGVATPLGEIALTPNADNVILGGIKAGYQTMDALAALPFGIIILQSAASKGYTTNGQKFKIVSGSAILAGVLLLGVYMGLCYLGATVSTQYGLEIGRAELVMAIVEALLGKAGMIIFGVVVGLACVTTAIGLTSSAAASSPSCAARRCPTRHSSSLSVCSAPLHPISALTASFRSRLQCWTSFIRRHWSLSSSRSLSPMQTTMSAAARLSAQLARASCVRSRSPQWRIFPCTTWACTGYFRPSSSACSHSALQQSSSPGSPKRKQKSDISSHEPQLVAFLFPP